jgi:hypothetical protein
MTDELTRIKIIEATGGVLEMSIITPLLSQEPEPVVTKALLRWLKRFVIDGEKQECMCCNVEFSKKKGGIPPVSFAVFKPFISPSKTHTAVFIFGLCGPCSASSDLKARALRVWREAFPNFRELEGGHS